MTPSHHPTTPWGGRRVVRVCCTCSRYGKEVFILFQNHSWDLIRCFFFQSESIDIFLISPRKHMLWVLIRSASWRKEKHNTQSYLDLSWFLHGLILLCFPLSSTSSSIPFTFLWAEIHTRVAGGGRVVQRCCVSYVTRASNWYWLTVGQGLLPL